MAPKKKAAPKPKITTPDNTTFGLTDIGFQNAAKNAVPTPPAPVVAPIPGQTSDLTETEKNIFGVYTTKTGLVIPGKDPDKDLDKKTDTPKNDNNQDRRDAFALIEELFRSYGLEELVPVITGYMKSDVGPNEAKVLLKQNPIYKTRFAGNELRLAKGLNVLSESEYLALENDYTETLTSYGLSDYFGSGGDANARKSKIAAMSNVIGGDISAVEFKDRIKTAVTRVKDADAGTKDAFRSLYNVTDTDLVKYFLDPKTGSAQLQQKVAAAEISGASLNAGLGLTSLGSAEELAKLGITKAMAQTGYANIAEYLPRTTSLGNIYNETGIQYTKTTGEEEEFKGLASAKRKRERLKELETGTFKGSSGTNKVSLAQKTGSF
jgi:hypothetical protein